MPADKFLPAIGHAVSGAVGTAISTTATYPLDLVNTRLKVQRTIAATEQYDGLLDAFTKIYEREGGLGAFYAGLGSDVAKSVADSFLFFLFYTWFRSRRSRANSRRLPAWEELAVGAAAGACARLFTTPISTVVTRKQTASLITAHEDANLNQQDITGGGDGGGRSRSADLSFAEVLHVIRAERGLLGLWSGYSATLVLTLNPSITFYLQHALKKALVEDRGRGVGVGEGGAMTFLVAALSKVVATAATYPFNIGKTRMQVSVPDSPSRRLRRLCGDNIFTTIMDTARAEGVSALYDGLPGELLKAFFNHGTTMLSKEIVHGLLVRLYFFILAVVQRSSTSQVLLSRLSSTRYGELRHRLMRGALVMSLVEWTRKNTIVAR
ncbi:mitochondrial carrier [Cryphonectria parasitica EP155]|uniref:Mitochondrial carrier n=1 Tax=Cryphonectria parasitica (strain ATCC 38755 / EP155) TaxID=660469 RepID=A0A9P4YBE2_CRYP1|nr:mitochondrial carrier [Cryphonectria parasitica EP155]KAF3769904.1 mitochondrial carrier [Cryphonectria parasitica EP155]